MDVADKDQRSLPLHCEDYVTGVDSKD